MRTHNELAHRGDLAALQLRNLSLEIDPDGVAWAAVEGCEICFHHGKGWLPTVDLQTIVDHHLDLSEAIATATRYREVDTKVQRDDDQRLLDAIFRRGWPGDTCT